MRSRLVLAVSLILVSSAFSLLGGALPVTANEVGLMLRSGYSSASVERELAYLAAHGTLHLLGYDHERGPEDDHVWRRKQ